MNTDINTIFSGGEKRRGINVISFAELMGITARAKDNDLQQTYIQLPLFTLSIWERINIFMRCSPVFGVVTSRMNRISGMDYDIVPEMVEEDKIYNELKFLKQIYMEYEKREELKYMVARQVARKRIMDKLPDVLPDMSNFDQSVVRWRHRIREAKKQSADEIYDWLRQPNANDSIIELIKKYVFDLMVHGNASLYKEIIDGKVENIYVLPGGTVYPLRSAYLGGATGYVQWVIGYEPQLFFSDEISWSQYVPLSSISYGAVPLEALVNKIAESLLFDKLMAEQADGTKPPSKVVVFGDTNAAFGSGLEDLRQIMPLSNEEQERIEAKLNTLKKNAIVTLSGVGQPMVLDLTRENTMSVQLERQKQIREEVALVFNMSNMEVNLSGSEDTSGRATSESQERIEMGKGIAPIIALIEMKFNHDILPYRYGNGFEMRIKMQLNEREQLQLERERLESGLYTLNEIRTEYMNMMPLKGEQFDMPKGYQPPQEQGGDAMQQLAGMMGG